jgi:dTDP-glucose pyrophosphorylase
MYQILIPAAGAGSRFADAGFNLPKPLINVCGKPMIQRVLDSIAHIPNPEFTFVIRLSDHWNFDLSRRLREMTEPLGKCNIFYVEHLTSGAAVTALRAKAIIDNGEPLFIANSDQIIETQYRPRTPWEDGVIYTFRAEGPKWSYVARDNDGRVWGVAEKQVLSAYGTVGLYQWSRGADFVKYAEQMIRKGHRCNGEFYIAPVYNEAISDGKRIVSWEVLAMDGVGTPEDLRAYEDKHRRAGGAAGGAAPQVDGEGVQTA